MLAQFYPAGLDDEKVHPKANKAKKSTEIEKMQTASPIMADNGALLDWTLRMNFNICNRDGGSVVEGCTWRKSGWVNGAQTRARNLYLASQVGFTDRKTSQREFTSYLKAADGRLEAWVSLDDNEPMMVPWRRYGDKILLQCCALYKRQHELGKRLRHSSPSTMECTVMLRLNAGDGVSFRNVLTLKTRIHLSDSHPDRWSNSVAGQKRPVVFERPHHVPQLAIESPRQVYPGVDAIEFKERMLSLKERATPAVAVPPASANFVLPNWWNTVFIPTMKAPMPPPMFFPPPPGMGFSPYAPYAFPYAPYPMPMPPPALPPVQWKV